MLFSVLFSLGENISIKQPVCYSSFRLITMLLSCIYAVVYFGSYAFLRGVISGQHGKKGIATLCASF